MVLDDRGELVADEGASTATVWPRISGAWEVREINQRADAIWRIAAARHSDPFA